MIKICGPVRFKPHPSSTPRAVDSSFEVKVVVRGIKRSGMLDTTPCSAALFPIIVFCSGLYFLWPLFLLLLDSIAERTCELEDALDVDWQLLAVSFPLEVQK